MKNALFTALFILTSGASASAAPLKPLKCEIVETIGIHAPTPHQEHYQIDSSDPKVGFTTNNPPTTGFYAQSRIDHLVYLSTIYQVIDGKNWIQVSWYRNGQILGGDAAYDRVKIGLLAGTNTPDETFEADCNAD